MRLKDLKKNIGEVVIYRYKGLSGKLPLFAIDESKKKACVGTVSPTGDPIPIWLHYRNFEEIKCPARKKKRKGPRKPKT